MIPKIAIIISHPIPHFCPMYNSLSKKQQWEIKVFFGSAAGYKNIYDPLFAKEINWDNLNLDFPHVFMNNERVIPINKQLDATELNNQLSEYNPNVLIIYGISHRIQKRAFKWGLKNKRKILMIRDTETRSYKTLLTLIKRKFILPRIFSNISGFLTVGNSNEDFYRFYNVPDIKFFRSPFPIDIKLFDEVFQNKYFFRNKIRNAYKIPEKNIVISVVGKLIHYKRQADLIKLMKILDNNKIQFTLLLIGSGPDEIELKKMAQVVENNQVIFCGFIQPKELATYYAATDIYIHPAMREPHSLAISEAIYLGCPIILSNKCGSYGPTDDIQPGRNGFVYPCGDISYLKEVLLKIANNKKLFERMSNESIKISRSAQQLAHGEGLKYALTAINVLERPINE